MALQLRLEIDEGPSHVPRVREELGPLSPSRRKESLWQSRGLCCRLPQLLPLCDEPLRIGEVVCATRVSSLPLGDRGGGGGIRRDRGPLLVRHATGLGRDVVGLLVGDRDRVLVAVSPVSYTHLTLPTI